MRSFKEFLSEGPASPFLRNKPSIKNIRGEISRTDGSKDKTSAHQAVRDMYKKLLPQFKNIKKKFERAVNKSLPKGDKQKIRFFSQIKPEDSLVNKIVVRGNAPETIGDIVRGALLFPDQGMVEKFVKDFRRKSAGLIVAYEMKKKGQDKELGYFGSHHFDLMIDGLIVELQVMTRKMWKYKEAAHVLYTQNRDKISAGGHASKQDRHLSKQIYALANREDFEGISEDDFDLLLDEDFAAFEEVLLDAT